MTQPNRLPGGGRVDRGRTLDFTFNGRSYAGFHGDTLASALLANGVRLVGRSFKYHRPRGIVGSGVEEPNALVQLGTGAQTLPNYVATQIELYDGLEAASVNCWPSVGFDLRAVNGLISRFLPPGFYYKTFMWPRSLWPFYERRLRGAGGLGVAPTEPDTDRYDKMHAHCDVLVVGAGPAGIAAASGGRPHRSESYPGGRAAGARRQPAGQPPAGRGRAGRRVAGVGARRPARYGRGPPHGAQHGVRVLRSQLRSRAGTGHGPPGADPTATRRVSASGESERGRSSWRRAPSSAHWSSETTTAPASCSRRRHRPT